MRSVLPFVVLYVTEFILDTNAIDCYHKFDHQPRRGKPRRESRVDREERLVFVRRLPANRPFTGGFSFRLKKIKIAIDFSRRFAIIILPSPGNGKPRQMRVDRGGTHGFQGRPPTKPLVTTGGFPFILIYKEMRCVRGSPVRLRYLE